MYERGLKRSSRSRHSESDAQPLAQADPLGQLSSNVRLHSPCTTARPVAPEASHLRPSGSLLRRHQRAAPHAATAALSRSSIHQAAPMWLRTCSRLLLLAPACGRAGPGHRAGVPSRKALCLGRLRSSLPALLVLMSIWPRVRRVHALPSPSLGTQPSTCRLQALQARSPRKQQLQPNFALNRTRYGMPPWPQGARCSSCASRPGRHASARRLAPR